MHIYIPVCVHLNMLCVCTQTHTSSRMYTCKSTGTYTCTCYKSNPKGLGTVRILYSRISLVFHNEFSSNGKAGLIIQNSALSKQSAAVNTICLVLTIEADGELGKVNGIKSYLGTLQKKNAALIWVFSNPGLIPLPLPPGILELLGHFSVG